MIEIELAIYSTADWYLYRGKILSKIEEVKLKNKFFSNSFSFVSGTSWSSC